MRNIKNILKKLENELCCTGLVHAVFSLLYRTSNEETKIMKDKLIVAYELNNKRSQLYVFVINYSAPSKEALVNIYSL